MISLHSCFVAGLTLVYCIWRARSLFSYDTLEATRDCSQSLTIFGEKWPGAVKYRDIFDALSGNLLKTIVNPGPLALPKEAPSQHHTNPAPAISHQAPQSQQTGRGDMASDSSQATGNTMGHLVSDAVKEAFMEVDDEAPGGWQGWRMWRDMVDDDATLIQDPASRSRPHGFGDAEMCWSGYEGLGTYGVDPVQDAAMQMGSYAAVEDSQWELDGSR